jgi:fibronectin-binding autotransporter adhesin
MALALRRLGTSQSFGSWIVEGNMRANQVQPVDHSTLVAELRAAQSRMAWPFALTAFAMMFAVTLDSRGATFSWQVASGDWSVTSNWGGSIPTSADYAYIADGGTATLTTDNNVCSNLSLGDVSGNGYLQVTSGSLLIQNEADVGWNGIGGVLQFGGAVVGVNANGNLNLGSNVGAVGTYNLSGTGQLLLSGFESIDASGIGIFTQSGGIHNVGGGLDLGTNVGSAGTYFLSGGSLAAGNYETIGYNGGSGLFNQSGGSNTCNSMSIGSASSSGTYTLSGTGQCSTANLTIGNLGCLQLTGGTFAVGSGGILVNQGLCQIFGGTMSLTGGMVNQGIVDGGNQPGLLTATGGILDFSAGTLQNMQAATINLGPGTLLIVPSGFTTGQIGHFTSLGLTHTVGTTLNVPAGQGFSGQGTINDPVVCAGSINCSNLNLNGPLNISGTGAVNLGGGMLTTSDNSSGMTGGSLSLDYQVIGRTFPYRATFNQSGGMYRANELDVTNSQQTAGTYSLSGSAFMSVSELLIGNGGNGLFQQSGGTVVVNNIDDYWGPYGQIILINGSYSLSGNSLLHVTGYFGESIRGGVFNQSGGTHIVDDGVGVFSTYNLSGPAVLSAGNLQIWNTFNQNGGLSSVGQVDTEGVYNLNAGTLQAASLTGYGTINYNGGLLQITSPNGLGDYTVTYLVLGPGLHPVDTGSNNVYLTTLISGSGGLEKRGDGTLTLSPFNPYYSYSGNTLITAGVLALGSSLALQQSTVDTSGSGSLDFGDFTDVTLGGLTGSGALNLFNDSWSAVTLDAGNNNASTTYSGTISGPGSLIKIGSGTLVLSGTTNTYSGGTTVLQGELVIEYSGGLSDCSNLIVGNPLAFAPVVAAVVPPDSSPTSPVPEPEALTLLAAGVIFLPIIVRQRKQGESRAKGERGEQGHALGEKGHALKYNFCVAPGPGGVRKLCRRIDGKCRSSIGRPARCQPTAQRTPQSDATPCPSPAAATAPR